MSTESEVTNIDFFMGAVNQSGTATVMIDRDFNITYVNSATITLMQKHEAAFQKRFPGFVASKDAIMGTCIDLFHKTPSHQRQMLANSNNLPYKTDIQIEHLIFELNVTAILDSAGGYIGNSLEWRDVTEMRASDDSVARLQGAIDQSGTAVIMINRNLDITYANKATIDLMKNHEATFQKKYPGFRATTEAVVGTNIDVFHKNPAHQRQLLADANNLPYVTDIKVAHLTFALNVTAIVDNAGNYIGNALEWSDVTEARISEDNVSRLQGAIDQSGTPVIMINRNLEITYANKSTIDLMKGHEATFQKKYPGFMATAEAIIGTNIDVFHKNPAHQRQLLSDANNLPYATDITIEHLTFALNVTAIVDNAGNYIGNSLEWQDVTEQRNSQVQIGRLSSAVEGMTTNMMMADTDCNIVYMNSSVTAMLRRRESELRSALPGFNVDKLMGANIDTFHKNPSHQRNLLSNPSNLPYNSNIAVGGLEFNLTAIALRDSEGEHVGTAVQWVDTTEENDAQRQIEGMINAAVNGQLEQRIDAGELTGFLKKLGEGINTMLDALVEPITGAISVTQSLARGDLSESMDGEYEGEFLALANAVNESMDNLRSMVGEIRGASTNVFSAAREIAQGNNDLSQRTEAQAASLEETASAMEELTQTVKANADNATVATEQASSAMAKASSGGEVVKSAVGAMEEINTSSKKISDIIGVIDEIAFQTNLLALNAAVEAARAGEQGRGFAVVAAEVRNLAQRSAGAAKEIKGLINDSVDAVGKGTRLVDETGSTFDDLVDSVREVVKMISEIDNASSEQAAGIGEVSTAVSQMDEMTQQNAALVEQATASSKAMEEQAQGLLDQIGFFSLGDEDNNDKGGKRKRKPAAKSSSGKKRQGVARKSSSDEDWEEF